MHASSSTQLQPVDTLPGGPTHLPRKYLIVVRGSCRCRVELDQYSIRRMCCVRYLFLFYVAKTSLTTVCIILPVTDPCCRSSVAALILYPLYVPSIGGIKARLCQFRALPRSPTQWFTRQNETGGFMA
ncbi:hypothetical protein F4861DRAFT_119411 [Xylaria intraflava]|nr:hypothetical protein F4861DRAFT_119411 [Xylaria intraflava]